MYYFPTRYSLRHLYPYDYSTYPSYYNYGPRTTIRYYNISPYISSYSDGRYELLRRTLLFIDYPEESRPSRSRTRSPSPVRSLVRASSIPPRSFSPEPVARSARASSVPPIEGSSLCPVLVRYSPKLIDGKSPDATYVYHSKMPELPARSISNPLSFGPRIYTNLSVFPTMKHSSYSLLTPIDRYKYRTVPTKSYSGYPSTSYYSYPTPTSSTASAYRQSDVYPTRFQINRINSPALDSFHAGRRTVY